MARRPRGIEKTVHSQAQAAFKELLIAARKRAKLTQRGLAQRRNKPQSFIAKYEGGERRVDVLEFLAIARAIGADPVRLLRELMRRTA